MHGLLMLPLLGHTGLVATGLAAFAALSVILTVSVRRARVWFQARTLVTEVEAYLGSCGDEHRHRRRSQTIKR
jgi:hypothetical protein